jgi:hypothetical protein
MQHFNGQVLVHHVTFAVGNNKPGIAAEKCLSFV